MILDKQRNFIVVHKNGHYFVNSIRDDIFVNTSCLFAFNQVLDNNISMT